VPIIDILNYCIKAKVYGIICFEMGLTLREGDREFFYKNLDKHFPGIKEKYKSRYGNNYILISDNNKELMEIFNKTYDENNIVHNVDELFNYMRTFEERKIQLELF
jgi:hypothetical protein